MMRGIMDEETQITPAGEQNTPPTDPTQSTQQSDIERLIATTVAESNRRAEAAERRARELEDKLTLASQQQTQQTQQTQNTPNDNDFWQNPVQNITTLIQSQIAPLNQFTQQIAWQNQYTALKQQYRQYPAFAQIESTVDQFMSGKQLTHENMQQAITMAVGQLVLTNPAALQQPAVAQEEKKDPAIVGEIKQRPVDTQAHLRPSKNTPVAKDDAPKRRPLTENERRLLKEMKMTEERFWELQDAGTRVDTWKKETK